MEGSSEKQLKGWTKDDKLRLHSALKCYGSYCISDLQDFIPNKTKEEIEEALIFFRNKALKQEKVCSTSKVTSRVKGQASPLNSWAELLTETFSFNELRTETATALKLIADFEDIPQAVCTDTIDFRKVYYTLANALEGKALCEDKHVAAVLDKCIIETALTSKAFMRCNAFKNVIKDIKIHENDINNFIKPTDNNELSMLRHILMLRNYNPMNIPEEHLKFSTLS